MDTGYPTYTFEMFTPETVSVTCSEFSFDSIRTTCTGCFQRIEGRWFEIGKLTYWMLRWFGRDATIARWM